MKWVLILIVLLTSMKLSCQVDKIRIEKDSIEENPDEPFDIVEESAEFPGGVSAMYQYMKKNLPLPDTSCAGSYGTIYIKFTINEQGDVQNVQVLRGLMQCPSYNSTLIKVFQAMPRFKPGYLNGKPVKCYFNLPIRVRWQ